MMNGLITRRLVTADEVAEYLQVKRRTVVLWAMQRRIPSVRMGARTIRYNMEAVLNALQNGHKTHENQPESKKSEGCNE